MTTMIKQLERKPNRSFTSDEKNIKATELRLEAKINIAIERVNEALKKQDAKIQSLLQNPIKRHARISSIQNTNHQLSRDSLATSVKKPA